MSPWIKSIPPELKKKTFVFHVELIGGPPWIELDSPVVRMIEIKAKQTLDDLHHVVFDAFDRDDEHMYEFQLGAKRPMDQKAVRYSHPFACDDPFGASPPKNANKTEIGTLGLCVGDIFFYWFDFGDDWMHEIKLATIGDEEKKAKYPRLTESVGESPEQYPDEDDRDDEDDLDEDEQ